MLYWERGGGGGKEGKGERERDYLELMMTCTHSNTADKKSI